VIGDGKETDDEEEADVAEDGFCCDINAEGCGGNGSGLVDGGGGASDKDD